ncbi:hypothetical protein [Micromonospora chalcea]|uniref:hypothetical protein n=1 Tax=Micromonospora chalcea TaxID=1874 RepID=UPI003D714ED0
MAISRVDDQEAMPSSATGTVTVNAPAGVSTGDLVLHLFSMLHTTATVTEPAGLTALGAATSGTNLTARLRSRVTGAATMLVGMDAPLGSSWTAATVDYPGIQYTRDFGKDNLYGNDADTLTEPTPYGQGKWNDLPSGAVMHISWKDDPGLLQTWMDALPDLPPSHPGFYVSPWHEPRDEVDSGEFTTAQFRAWGKQMTDIVAAHPKKYLIRGVGPILTRYDLDEKNANPADYGWAGMDFFGVDCYQSDTSVGYYSTTKMFETVFNKIHAAFPGIPLMVPEYGMVKLPSDTTGAGRAAAITTHINYLRARGDVLAVAYFNDTGSIPGVPIAKTSPEADAWRAQQAMSVSEASSYTWATNASPKTGAWAGAYRGLHATTPISAAAVTAGVSSAVQTTPPVNVPAGGWLVYGVAARHTPGAVGVSSWSTSATGEAKRADLATNSGSSDITIAVFDSGGPLSATTGATRTLTSTIAETNAVVFAVALNPASTTGTGTDAVLGIPVF